MAQFDYTVVRKARRKTASIVVQPNRTVQFIVPAGMRADAIEAMAIAKQRWVAGKLAELEKSDFQRIEHSYLDGERFLFQGRYLTLMLRHGRGNVEKKGDTLVLSVPPGLSGDDRRCYARAQLTSFCKTQARSLLRRKTRSFGQLHGLEAVHVNIKDYKSRWGCCFGDGRIYYNWKIIMAPEYIMDYVVAHELCHLRIANHSYSYWQLVATIIPDWRERRQWLRINGHALDIT